MKQYTPKRAYVRKVHGKRQLVKRHAQRYSRSRKPRRASKFKITAPPYPWEPKSFGDRVPTAIMTRGLFSHKDEIARSMLEPGEKIIGIYEGGIETNLRRIHFGKPLIVTSPGPHAPIYDTRSISKYDNKGKPLWKPKPLKPIVVKI